MLNRQTTPARRMTLFLLALALASCSSATGSTMGGDTALEPAISSEIPPDIEGGASEASLAQAARFSWEQLIALNWPAGMKNGKAVARGQPVAPGAQVTAAPRAWETLRAKTELFPGIGQPHGSELGPTADYGYDQPPLYRYDPKSVGSYDGIDPGEIPACDASDANVPTPWIELSESHEVGPEKMYAGMAPFEAEDERLDRQRVLYAVKVDRSFYNYVVSNGWLDGGNPGSTVPAAATAKYLQEHKAQPPAGSSEYVSFPNGSTEIKSAWRRLSEGEFKSGRFFTSLARAYQPQDASASYGGVAGNPDHPCYVDAYWGLVGIHIKTRTATASAYTWSSFEHIDNLVDKKGKGLEDSAGRYTGDPDIPATDPEITSRNAMAATPETPETIQKMWPATANAEPERRLYYQNRSNTPTTQGIIAVNRREHAVAGPVVAVNEAAHRALRRFMAQPENRGLLPESLLNYRLVGVQWRPANKPVPGEDVLPDQGQKDEVLRYPSIYYLANLTMETSYRLQNFSGMSQPHLSAPNQDMGVQDLVTDFDASGQPVKNVVFAQGRKPGQATQFNMGGCMGCHGQIQGRGYDFSYVFRRGRINEPEIDVSIRLPLIDMVHPRDRK